jgi:GxxExxY protein
MPPSVCNHIPRLEDRISRHIVDSAIEIHRNLGGPGLLESVYEEVLIWELKQSDLIVE